MKLKPYIRLYESEDDKYYDVTIDNPETNKEIKLMTALDYPEDSKVYKKAVEIKDYLDRNEGKGIENSEDVDDKQDSKELDSALDSILHSDFDSSKKKVLSDKIKKAEELRKKFILYKSKLEKALQQAEEDKKDEIEELLSDVQDNLDSLNSKIKDFSTSISIFSKK